MHFFVIWVCADRTIFLGASFRRSPESKDRGGLQPNSPAFKSGRPRELPPQAPTEPYLRLSPHTALHVPCQSTSLPEPLAHPISGWPKSHSEHVSPFAPFPLQKLHHYYELIRPCPPHWYFRFHGSAIYTFSLSIDRQVLKFRALAKVRVTPPLHRTPRGQ